MEYYITLLGGCILYLLLQLNGVYQLSDFKWKTFLRGNWISTIINLLIGIVLIYYRESIASQYQITGISSFILGVSGQALFKKLNNLFDKEKETYIGINK